jgi:formimidoylglutamate deiminase
MCIRDRFQAVLAGGAAAASHPQGGLTRGARADFVVIDTQVDALAGVDMDHLLDALVFACDLPAWAGSWVAGNLQA